MFIIMVVLNSAQWQLSLKYGRKISMAVRLLFITIAIASSVLFAMFNQTHIVVGLIVMCSLLICGTYASLKRLKVSKEKILLGV
jgi:hypothetical protein